MDMKKFVDENALSEYPVGLGGCRISDLPFNSCDYDVFIFDGKSEPNAPPLPLISISSTISFIFCILQFV